MIKQLLFAVSSIFLPFVVSAQYQPEYYPLVQEAHQLYQNESFLASGQKYAEAFALSDLGEVGDRYNAACSWALAGQSDSAFAQLFRIAERGNYSNHEHLTTDVDLKSLYSDERWGQVTAQVKQNLAKVEAGYDKPLVAMLDTIYREDQHYRVQLDSIGKVHGRGSEEYKAQWRIIHEKDSINQLKITKLLDERGWLGPDVVGERGSGTLFLVIQHAELPMQEKYLPMMRTAVREGKTTAANLALLEDRVAMKQGKKQIYGSQIGTDSLGNYFVYSLLDPLIVDERRAKVGLPPLADYVSRWDIVWDAEAYARQMAEEESEHAIE